MSAQILDRESDGKSSRSIEVAEATMESQKYQVYAPRVGCSGQSLGSAFTQQGEDRVRDLVDVMWTHSI